MYGPIIDFGRGLVYGSAGGEEKFGLIVKNTKYNEFGFIKSETSGSSGVEGHYNSALVEHHTKALRPQALSYNEHMRLMRGIAELQRL